MAKMINWNTAEFEAACVGVGMDRLEAAAHVIADDAKRILAGKLKGDWREHGPYERRYAKGKQRGGLISYQSGGGSTWTARYHGAMVDTIRVVRKKDSTTRNVWIMAGNYNVWWALQLEYGRGGWKGGAKPFLRPAMKNAPSSCAGILEGGGAGTETI